MMRYGGLRRQDTHQRARKAEGRARNKRTVETEARMAKAAAAVANALPDAFQGDAHALLMLVYKDLANPLPLRVDAAKAAIRYEKPALSTVQAKLGGEFDVRAWLAALDGWRLGRRPAGRTKGSTGQR